MKPFSKSFSAPSSDVVPTFTDTEWNTLLRLHAQYRQNPDLWTDREFAHLCFLRWLAQTGLLAADGYSPSERGRSRRGT